MIFRRSSIQAWAHSKIPLLWKALISHNNVGSKTENAQNQILLRQKDATWGGELAQTSFAENMWREIQKVGSPSSRSCTVSSSHVSSDTMLDFYHLDSIILGSLTEIIASTRIKHKRQ